MAPLLDYTERLYAVIAPSALGHHSGDWEKAEVLLKALGSEISLADIVRLTQRADRSIPVDPDGSLKLRDLKILLAGLVNEGVGPADWPFDYLDTERKHYKLSYLFSQRHLIWLVCRRLSGHHPPPDLAYLFYARRVHSRCIYAANGDRWLALHGGRHFLGFDAW